MRSIGFQPACQTQSSIPSMAIVKNQKILVQTNIEREQPNISIPGIYLSPLHNQAN